MIKNNVWYEFFASYTVPNHEEVGYWIDLGANSKGKVIKVYNQDIRSWVKVTDATSEDAVSPFIGSNGNWWVDNRDTGIPAAGKNPYIDEDTYTWWMYDSINSKYVDTGIYPEGKSAYILAVEHGFKGTEEEWLESLKKPALDAAAAALDAANKANEVAENLEDSINRANEAASNAEEAADRANTIASNPPKIINNLWYIYNEETQEYESTNVSATGDPLYISKTYPSISEMNADFDNIAIRPGQFVMIDSDTEDPDNAKLFVKGDVEWIFISDLSGSQGITGMSAYQIAVQNGFVGTEEEWVQSLKQPALDAAEEVLDIKSSILATEAEIKDAEALRVIAENNRTAAETDREANEQNRSLAENNRELSEASRVLEESNRVEAEKTRVNNDAGRAQNESERVKNELARQNNEIAREDKEEERESNEVVRKESEDIRVSQENDREDAENARVLSESARVTSEQDRITAETLRESQEAVRQANEAIRETQEASRQTNTTNAITAVNKAKTEAEKATTNAVTAANAANTQADRAKEYADNPPKIVTNYWHVWDDTTDAYVNTNVNATGEPGKTPIIKSGTWWLYDNETGNYVDTNISVNSQYELTKEKVEAVLTGDISTHTHDTMYIADAPTDNKQYVRQDGDWVEIDDLDLSNYLAKDNITTYEPTADYNPATKKYVDDAVSSVDVTDQISGKADTTYVNEQLDKKVDKVSGKQLSTNDFTNADKNKLSGIEEGAEVNVNADWNATSGDAQILNKPVIITEEEIDQKISTAVGAVYKVKGSVASYEMLPTENVSVGDVYNLEDTGANYVAISTTPDWDKLSETVDLSGYLTKTDATNTYQLKGDYLTSIPDEYVTDTKLNSKLQDYSTTETINNTLQGFEEEVNNLLNNKLDTTAYTAADVLSKVKTVDGSDSGLDADLLDGKHGSEYALKTDIPDLIIVDSDLSTTSENPVQNKIITNKVNELTEKVLSADEIYISEGVEPTKQEEVWIDLSDNSFDEMAIEDAPKDGKQYARKNGQWVVIGSIPSGETVKIVVTSNQAQPDVDINGSTITLVYGNVTKNFVWEGTEITTEVPTGVTYTITCSNIEGYSTPEVQEYTALATNTRNVLLSYNTTITTISVTSNHPTLFPTNVDVTLDGGFQKSLTGSLTYTVKIPTNVEYTVKGSEVKLSTDEYYRQFNTPLTQTVTATGTTQSINLIYNGTKVSLSVTTDEGIISPTISITPSGWSHTVTSGTTIDFVFSMSGYYQFSGGAITSHIKPDDKIISVDNTYTDKTVTLEYLFLAEETYAMWVEFDDTTGTTTLNRGGNLDVIINLTNKFRRCLALPQNDGTAAITYLNATDSNNFLDGSPVSDALSSSDDKTNYYMVHFPKYYYRSEEIATNKWKLYISERKINENYKEERECLVGVFESQVINTGKALSKPGVNSTGLKQIEEFFNASKANGSNWGLIDYRVHKTIANLFCAKYGNTNIDTANDAIPCSGGNKPHSNGFTGGTMTLGNVDGVATVNNYNGYKSSNFLGLEDCYRGKMEVVQGVNVLNRRWIVYDGGLKVNTDISALRDAGYTNVREIGVAPRDDGYIVSIKHGDFADVVPVSINNGSSTTYYSDYYQQTAGSAVFMRSSESGAVAGVFFAYARSSSNSSGANSGMRLGFYGDIIIKTKEEFLTLTAGYNG